VIDRGRVGTNCRMVCVVRMSPDLGSADLNIAAVCDASSLYVRAECFPNASLYVCRVDDAKHAVMPRLARSEIVQKFISASPTPPIFQYSSQSPRRHCPSAHSLLLSLRIVMDIIVVLPRSMGCFAIDRTVAALGTMHCQLMP
jgi:hypothetical protein